MKFYLGKTIPNQEAIKRIVSSLSKEHLEVLNSCKTYEFEMALIKVCQERELKFRYKTGEEALPAIERITTAVEKYCTNPLSEELLFIYCRYVRGGFFKDRW